MLYYNSKWCGAVVCSAKYMQQECSYVGEAGAEAGGRAMVEEPFRRICRIFVPKNELLEESNAPLTNYSHYFPESISMIGR